jgi:AraC-like DNA-binding protein
MKQELRSAFNTRQHMLSKDFEIYYYSDLHFQQVAPHRHDYYEFHLFLEGDAAIMIGDDVMPLQRETLALIPPGVLHHSVVAKDTEVPYRRFVFWVSADFAARLLSESPDYAYLFQQAASGKRYLFRFPSNGFNLILSKMIRLLEEVHGNRYGRSAFLNLCVCDLLLSMNRCVYEEEHRGTGSEKDLFQEILAYLEEHLAENLSLDRLAEHFYVSKYYIAHLFRDTLGISVHQYLQKKRLDACRSALLSGENLSRAAAQYGFSDYSAFYRAFRKEYGMSPSQYLEVSEAGTAGSAKENQ